MKAVVSIVFCLVCSFLPAEEFKIVESDRVHSDGKQMFFEGGIHFENDLGKIFAKKAVMTLEPTKGLFGWNSIDLYNDVLISFDDRFEATCDHASCHSGEVFILNDNVTVKHLNFGSLTTDKELYLKRSKEKGVGLEYLKCSGKTVLQVDNEEKDLDFTFLCHGEVFLDHGKREVLLSSPKNDEGKVDDSQQLFFQDHKGKLLADEAVITYDILEKDRILPLQIDLRGNVRITNREGAILQYALADRVIFSFKTQELKFIASEKKRVLFYDKINNLQVSAPQMNIKRNKVTKKESFQGMGDVRFHFIEKEFEQIRKRFLLEKNSL